METDSELAECAAAPTVEGAVSMDLPVSQSSERPNDVLWQNGLPQVSLWSMTLQIFLSLIFSAIYD